MVKCPTGTELQDGKCVQKGRLYNVEALIECDGNVYVRAKSEQEAIRLVEEEGILGDNVEYYFGENTCGVRNAMSVEKVSKAKEEEMQSKCG